MTIHAKGSKPTPLKPWKEMEDIAKKTTDRSLIFIGDYIYTIISGSLLYLYTRRKQNMLYNIIMSMSKTERLVAERTRHIVTFNTHTANAGK